MENSFIEWTHHTFNPWWGCQKVSVGCQNCYANTEANRWGHDIWGANKPRRFLSDDYWLKPLKWNKEAIEQGVRKRVFAASMADCFEDNDSVLDARAKLWDLIMQTPMLDWLLVTKRPGNIMRFIPEEWKNGLPSNVWLLTSVENQEQAEIRIPELLKVPAVVRGLSVEPLLGPVDLTKWTPNLNWVIAGGESGAGSRPVRVEWVRDIRNQCIEVGCAFFFKQWGQYMPIFESDGVNYTMKRMKSKHDAGRTLDGRTWDEYPDVGDSLPIIE